MANDTFLKKLGGASPVQRTTMSFDVIRINFTQEGIGEIMDHMEELEAIRSASEHDQIYVYMSGCPGGYVDTAMSIINALIQTPAKTFAVLEGHNASAATMIPLACRQVVVTPYTGMMLHTASGGNYGTVANAERAAAHHAKQIHSFLDDLYEGFLSAEEIDQLKNGLEIYLGHDEIEERLQVRAKVLQCDVTEENETPCGVCSDCLGSAEAAKPVTATKRVKKAK